MLISKSHSPSAKLFPSYSTSDKRGMASVAPNLEMQMNAALLANYMHETVSYTLTAPSLDCYCIWAYLTAKAAVNVSPAPVVSTSLISGCYAKSKAGTCSLQSAAYSPSPLSQYKLEPWLPSFMSNLNPGFW